MKLLISFALLGVALAKCPNACSGHGDCAANDACSCFSGFQGGDCSERVCAYNWAWVTTAMGDLNFDGDVLDGTVYEASSALNTANIAASAGSGGSLLITQSSPGGTWESWPYFGSAEEGHFYMECSNRGQCDRQKGDCLCFDGYEGTSCNRMTCPEDCNGHGTCVTTGYYDAAYTLWDKDMARSCKCDPGYTGPACQTRTCPVGNDVLTKDNELPEIQYVDIYSNCDSATADSGCPTLAATSQLGGYARLTLTDFSGEAYTTAPFAVCAMGDTGCTAATVEAAAVAALEALPNNVTSSTIAVAAQYCEEAVDLGPAFDATAGDTGNTYGGGYRVAGSAGAKATAIYKGTVGVVPFVAAPVLGTDFSGETAVQIAELQFPHCIRLKITFNDMPGDISDLAVDFSDVTFAGLTNAQSEKTILGASVSSNIDLTQGATLSALYRAPATNKITVDAATITRGTPTKIAYTTTGKFHAINGEVFYPGQKVKIECTDDSGTRSLGFYTVTDPTTLGTPEGMNADYIYVDEYVLPCRLSNTDSDQFAITAVQNVIQLSQATGTALAAFDPTKIQDFGTLSNTRIAIKVGTTTTYHFNAEVTQVSFFTGTALASTAFATSTGYIVIGGLDTTGDVVGHSVTIATGAVADVTPANLEGVLTGANDNSLTVTVVSDQDGTMESSECGDRGLCQDDGTCKCFAGYTGDSCSIQKSIAM